MNHSEIEVCIIQAKEGDHQALLKVLEQYKPFIFKTAKQFNIKNYELPDLIQIGYVALINAVSKYKTGSNTFGSYAYNSIKNALRYTARQNSKYDRVLSLNSPLTTSKDTETEFIDCIESLDNLEENILEIENRRMVRKALSKLSQEELELINTIYFNKCSLKSYADKKGLKYLHAVRKKNKVLEKLGCHLN